MIETESPILVFGPKTYVTKILSGVIAKADAADITRIGPKIKISDINLVREGLTRNSTEGSKKVALLDLTDSSYQVQNSLLRLIEENTTEAIFFLTSNDPEKIIETIKDRCFIFSYSFDAGSIIKDYVNSGVEFNRASFISRLARMGVHPSSVPSTQSFSFANNLMKHYDIESALSASRSASLEDIQATRIELSQKAHDPRYSRAFFATYLNVNERSLAFYINTVLNKDKDLTNGNS
ncbi:DNA polymerase III, delta subunit [uncultured Caudovirales phage]|uniref:DNA polymerase III, delta subunit n=1 Tax=uncultured Caudovirales phage TaxID=2100421 RepID=A0A6J5R5T4_9CAUD|nr:DNA polymerase III, delta subunit [uncultured Caudovirales phage]CAB4174833.1 DNA polymerase III, delta subunit [uncultured Caudovirales phage]CAB4180727.1 DNA polymerase III, delta subunit [uncultured Caudovirales phage]CAB4186300.1 DNA polymerase III, delta subunit [uncultured Caudovirales phage]CAB4190282.1 DNA polymerase III, delta subunit [uncultured Caudovirales phage]